LFIGFKPEAPALNNLSLVPDGSLSRGAMSGFGPDVWSGRASQEVFVDLSDVGLASMYPASYWSVSCSGPPWISARMRSH
jgi:hypothetical protein